MIIKDPKQIEFFDRAFADGSVFPDGVYVAFENVMCTENSISVEYNIVLCKGGALLEKFDPNDYYKPDPDWVEMPDHTMKRIQ